MDLNKFEVVAIIPARGGSKGIPNKNILPVCGKPLIAWTIIEAKKAATIQAVYVSTDDEKIIRVSEEYGAEVIMRPSGIAGDTTPSELALTHTLSQLQIRGIRPEIIAFLQCTSPLMIADDIDQTVKLVRDKEYDTAFTAFPYLDFIWKTVGDGSIEAVNHDPSFRRMRQGKERQYQEAGSVYAMKTAGFLQKGYRFFGKIGIYEVPSERSIEIDEPEDMKIAEFLLSRRDDNR